MIYIISISWTTKKHLKNTFQATTFKVEENSRTFQGFHLKFKDFSRLCKLLKEKIFILSHPTDR